MHPPRFLPDHRLSDWPECRIEVHCCSGKALLPTRGLAEAHGDKPFSAVLAKLRCSRCGKAPAPVFLCAGTRTFIGGAPADWAIELVPSRVD